MRLYDFRNRARRDGGEVYCRWWQRKMAIQFFCCNVGNCVVIYVMVMKTFIDSFVNYLLILCKG